MLRKWSFDYSDDNNNNDDGNNNDINNNNNNNNNSVGSELIVVLWDGVFVKCRLAFSANIGHLQRSEQ
jgi:hypothetical protein